MRSTACHSVSTLFFVGGVVHESARRTERTRSHISNMNASWKIQTLVCMTRHRKMDEGKVSLSQDTKAENDIAIHYKSRGGRYCTA